MNSLQLLIESLEKSGSLAGDVLGEIASGEFSNSEFEIAGALKECIRSNYLMAVALKRQIKRAAQPCNSGDVAPMGESEKSSGDLAQRA